MKKQPLVTVVTVIYQIRKGGRLPFLEQNIKSVSAQDYPEVEHLIIDGGSTDGTLEYLHSVPDKLRIVSEPDTGIFNAMNKGIRLAEGKYIAFLNSDDFYNDPSAISQSVRALERHHGDFSYAPCYLLDTNGNTTPYGVAIEYVFNQAPFYHLSMFTRKDVLEKENGFREDLRLSADSDLIARLVLKKYKYVYVNSPFATFRLGGSSVDAAACRAECCRFYYENFHNYCGLSRETSEKMVWNPYIPVRFFMALLSHGHYSLCLKILKSGRVKREGGCIRSAWKSFCGFPKRMLVSLMKKAYLFARNNGCTFQPQNETRPVNSEPPIAAQIRAASNVSVGEGTIFLPNAQMINPGNAPVHIGKDCILSNYFIFETDKGCIDIGNNVFINSQTQLISRNHIIIEDHVTIAWGCMLYDHNSHSLDPMVRRADMEMELRDYRECGNMLRNKDWSVVKSKPIRICKDAWLGFNVTVLAGVTIGEGAVIGAGSVVRQDIPPYVIAYGNPAVVVGKVRGYPKC